MNLIIPNQSKGIITIDCMLSIIPILMVLLLLSETISHFSSTYAQNIHSKKVMNLVLAVADNVVKSSAAIHSNGVRYPNWIDEQLITENLTETLREKTGLSSLYISTIPSNNNGTCVYRLVVSGPAKEIKQLFVCGD